MEAVPSIQVCQDCAMTIVGRIGVRQTRCLGCRQRYEVQLYLLRQYLARAL